MSKNVEVRKRPFSAVAPKITLITESPVKKIEPAPELSRNSMPSTNATTSGVVSASKDTAREIEKKPLIPKEKVMITGDDVLIEYVDRIVKLLKL